MNRKQRKAKQQRANQHRKIAKTSDYKRKQSDNWIRLYREHSERTRHWLDEPIEGMRMMTPDEVRKSRIETAWVFAGAFCFLLAFALIADWVAK